MKHVLGLGVAILALAASNASAQERLGRECRREIIQMCGLTFDRDKLRSCLVEKVSQLSSDCRGKLVARVRERMNEKGAGRTGERNASGGTEMRYGSDALQSLDFWRAAKPNAPMIVFVHGGGWKRGDKNNATGQFKAPHYQEQGYAFASINYRLVPAATVEQQAADIATSLSYLRQNAVQLGINPSQIVLMGHSAGAHLAALVGTDPAYLRAAGMSLADVKGVIPLDGAAYDVAAQMNDGSKLMQDAYKQAFGTDPARQRALSPTLHAAAPNAPAFLILHVDREDGARQSASLADALTRSGTSVELHGFGGKGLAGHMAINRSLGDPSYPATPVVDTWLKQIFSR